MIYYDTLISPAALAARLDDPDLVVVDCRFSLQNPAQGREAYLREHISGAVYAHLDEDLSGPIVPGQTGRHPLPSPEDAAETFGRWGITDGIQVAAYDDAGGGIAARLWWMLRYLGHEAVAVLDGGWTAWKAEHRPVEGGVGTNPPRIFRPRVRTDRTVDAAQVEALRRDPAWRLLDAREASRYRGEEEPIDPVAGHIPGAVSAPFRENLDASGRFLPPDALRARFERLVRSTPPNRVVSQCGSGVTACHNILAMEHAGLRGSRLYPGSWSEWITDPDRPVEGSVD